MTGDRLSGYCVRLFTAVLLLLAPSVSSGTGIYLNEFVAKNSTTLLSQFGEADDWIEIYNDTAQSVNLTGWYLTDSATQLTKWAFPAATLASKGYLVVWASGRNTVLNGEIHTNFKLDGDGEYLALVRPDGTTVEHAYTPMYPDQKTDISYGLLFRGNGLDLTLSPSQTECRYLVPTADIGTGWHAAAFDHSGWPAGLTGVGYDRGTLYDAYINTDVEALMYNKMASVYIRIPFEVDDPAELSSVSVKLRYEDGFAAWLNGVEIGSDNLPPGVTASNLAWNAAAPVVRDEGAAVVLTEVFATAAPQSFLVAGTNLLVIHGINKGVGSSDLLMQAEITATLVDEFDLIERRYFVTPTPGTVNSGSAIDFVKDTKFSVDRGFYTNALSLVISTATAGAEIRYTLDGSTPTDVTGTLYTGPIAIASTTVVRAAAFRTGWQPSDVDTQSYLFPAAVIRQPVLPAGWPALWSNQGTGITPYSDYAMDPDVVDSPAYAGEFPAVLTRIPTLSIVTDQSNLFGVSGIYDNSLKEGVAWERPASVELICPDGAEGFQVNCGIRMQGGASRSPESSPKHSFRLLFKDIYGPTKLDYPLFDDSVVDEFDTVVLRAGYNLSWIHRDAGQRTATQYARDLFARRVQSRMGHAASHGMMVHLYVNGLYWGIYNPSERPSADFTSSHLGGSKEDWDTTNSGEVVDGDAVAWNTMMALANGGLATPASYASFMQYCDVVNLADYMIINHYIGNLDWDDHNWYAGRRRRAGEGFQFFCWDSENSIRNSGDNRIGLNNNNKPSRLFTAARANPEFQLLVADRLHRQLFNDGPLTAVNAPAIWREISAVIDTVAVAESARWGDYRVPAAPYTVNDHYLPEQSRILNSYFPGRTATVLAQYAALGLYPALAAPEFAVHGGMFTNSATVTLSGPAAIYYTLDGSDPREFGTGAIRGTLLSGPVTLEHSTRVKARCYNGSLWSALTEADFYDLAPSPLRITEIMHSPRVPDAGEMTVCGDSEDYSFLEICNGGDETVGLVGVEFTDGIRFNFSSSPFLLLAPGEYAVVVKDRDAFAARYPGVQSTVAGEYLGSLSGSGEQVQVSAHGIGPLIDFEYNDARSWPLAACGAGHSLVPLNAESVSGALLSYGGNWRASWNVDGSPGAADSPAPLVHLCLNEIAAHTDLNDPAYPDYDSNDWIELYNSGDAAVSLSGFYLSDDPADLLKWPLPDGVQLNAGAFIAFDEITGFHTPYPAGFGINKAGEQILLSYAPAAALVRVADAIRFKGQANGAALGRIPDGTGYWVATVPTRSAANQPADSHPVISEIMYHPAEGEGTGKESDFEYIEICNPGPDAVPLWTTDKGQVVGSWRIDGEVSYKFPASTQLPAGSRILLLAFDPADTQLKAAFAARYNLSPAVPLFGPYEGKLSNKGGRITLEKPQAPDGVGDDISWIIVDELNYYDADPWMVPADGLGYALHRSLAGAAAADPASWMDGVPSPGSGAIDQPDLRITTFGLISGQCLLGFELLPDIDYTLESTTNLTGNVWQPCGFLKNQSGFSAPVEPAVKAEFYRLRRR